MAIPYEEPERIRPHTDYQDVYSHFCTRIEDLLSYRDFISSPIMFSQGKGSSNQRLFEVKAEDIVLKTLLVMDGYQTN